MPLDFTAIDFETANSSSASACSVGLAKVCDGRVVDRAGWFIRPPSGHDFFSMWNTRIHGITATDVVDAATWCDQLPDLLAYIDGDLVVAHNAGFDMGVIRGACTASFVDVPPLSYLCSLQVARRTYHLDSYRLPVAAMAAGFEDFDHHDALADAEACAAIVIHAARRHDAVDLMHLAAITGARLRSIGTAAPALSRPMALADARTGPGPGFGREPDVTRGPGLAPDPMREPTLTEAAVANLIRRSGASGIDGAVDASGRPLEHGGRIA